MRIRPCLSQVLALAIQVRVNSFVFMAEADFMPTDGMHAHLRRGASGALLTEARHAWDMDGSRHALLVPAFEVLPEVDATNATADGDAAAGMMCVRRVLCLPCACMVGAGSWPL